ncbi:alanine/glycine:cation symporter family protein [Thermocrispum municipale]|jgi:AGCS family alanine or glycine:cation symporter|uniref:alanine/glycine:cation symporter family protein n=1 Tax=Thermocrispum municipale TaxID=37926 RepID=UPI00041A83E9|nr:alanine/glycine:cation symporter family protein [Thermocrispum municipale]
MESLTEVVQAIADFGWELVAFVAMALGLLFTVLFKFTQIRRAPEMVRLITKGAAGQDGGISSFQALSMTLASRVGVGAIAGVATAIAAGGPGAIFWMAVTGLIGAASSYAESVLAQVYKRRIDGEHRGGIPYYIYHGLRMRWLALVAAAVAFAAYGFLVPGIQSNNISSSVEHAFGIDPVITGVIVTALVGFVIIGGTKRIVHVAQMTVPFMAVGYILVALVVIAVNFDRIPDAVGLIMRSAFGADEVFGGIVGYAIAWGIRRAIFTSVAGVGEGTYGAAAAQVSHPAKQGLVQAFSIYVDVLFVCMATGLLIVITDSYRVVNDAGEVIHAGQVSADLVTGGANAQVAIDTVFPGFGSALVAIAIFLFAFTSQVAFYYIASSNLVFLTKEKKNETSLWVLKIGTLVISFIGAVISADLMWAAGDIGYVTLGLINMVCILLLLPVVRKVYRDYEQQRKAGVDPVFDPKKLGIDNADYWLTASHSTADAKEH